MFYALTVLTFYVLVFASILWLRHLARADVAEWGGALGRGEEQAAPPPVPPASC